METIKQIAIAALEDAIATVEDHLDELRASLERVKAAGDPVPPDPTHPHP